MIEVNVCSGECPVSDREFGNVLGGSPDSRGGDLAGGMLPRAVERTSDNKFDERRPVSASGSEREV